MKQVTLHYNLFALHQIDNSYFVHIYFNITTKYFNNTRILTQLIFS